MISGQKKKVLKLYRDIIKTGRNWTESDPKREAEIRKYIIDEAHDLFRKHKDCTNPSLIQKYIEEGEARLEIGIHYHNPYPRPLYLAKNQDRNIHNVLDEYIPVYQKSSFADDVKEVDMGKVKDYSKVLEKEDDW